LSIAAFAGKPALAKQLDEWRLLPRPERTSELYFSDHRRLPASTTANVARPVVFAVHNLEHRTTEYRYSLTLRVENEVKERTVGSGTFRLTHNATETIHTAVTLPAHAKGRIVVKVNLQYMGLRLGDDAPSPQKQSIHYWTTVTDKPGQGKENRESG
jgi:hypothetical protein